MRKVFGIEVDVLFDLLYLDKEFEKVKVNIGEYFCKVLVMDKFINMMGDSVVIYISEKIKNNKEVFLFGLIYFNCWYNINYDYINIKDFNIYKFDFDGNSIVLILDIIIVLGQSGMENFKVLNNLSVYEIILAAVKGCKIVIDLLEFYRKFFLLNKINNEWLKINIKVYIVESKLVILEVCVK